MTREVFGCRRLSQENLIVPRDPAAIWTKHQQIDSLLAHIPLSCILPPSNRLPYYRHPHLVLSFHLQVQLLQGPVQLFPRLAPERSKHRFIGLPWTTGDLLC
mmetsp:Transcript_54092/g.110371  ORF Transcript_54092/g.110371 Transcript_54092/m.110371 type:complete len:102 (-) Transcript_54092:503-808(-)